MQPTRRTRHNLSVNFTANVKNGMLGDNNGIDDNGTKYILNVRHVLNWLAWSGPHVN